jgi:hypothetical protein
MQHPKVKIISSVFVVQELTKQGEYTCPVEWYIKVFKLHRFLLKSVNSKLPFLFTLRFLSEGDNKILRKLTAAALYKLGTVEI